MATFTMTLGDILDEVGDDPEARAAHVGLDTYPIFDEEYRDGLNQKIIDHFLTREIGAETVELFRLFLRRKMNEVMPLYNQLYKSERLNIDPLNTVSMKSVSGSETESTNEGKGETTSGSDAESRTVASEFPQSRLAGDGDYATSAQDSKSASQATGTSTENSTGKQNATSQNETTGSQGSQAALLLQYRETFMNVDLMVIEELDPLFMLVWENGDTQTGGYYNYGYFNGFRQPF